MREQRGKQAAASFLFKLAESVGTQGISFVVSVVLARLLEIGRASCRERV